MEISRGVVSSFDGGFLDSGIYKIFILQGSFYVVHKGQVGIIGKILLVKAKLFLLTFMNNLVPVPPPQASSYDKHFILYKYTKNIELIHGISAGLGRNRGNAVHIFISTVKE